MYKLTISLVVVVLSAIISVGWGIEQFYSNYMTNSEKDLIVNYKQLGRKLSVIVDSLNDSPNFINKWNVTGDGLIVLTDKIDFEFPESLKMELFSGNSLVIESEKRISIHYYLPRKELVLSFTPAELENSRSFSLLNMVFTLIFYLGVLGFILIWLHPLIKRLSLLRKTAIQFGAGDLSKRIKLSRSSYINDIEFEFNRMGAKIAKLNSDNKLISSAVSHDLRTPLSRLRFGIDVLSETKNVKLITKYQNRLSRDIAEMESLIDTLLNYSKLENSLVVAKKQKFDLSYLLQDCVSYFKENFANIDLVVCKREMDILGDEKYLRMLFNNLISNAVEYCNNKIYIELNCNDKFYQVNIHDDGPGIPSSKSEDIFKPFIKGDVKQKGNGIGLAIVATIANWHNIKIKVSRSTLLQGALFQLTFSGEDCYECNCIS